MDITPKPRCTATSGTYRCAGVPGHASEEHATVTGVMEDGRRVRVLRWGGPQGERWSSIDALAVEAYARVIR